MSVPPLDRDGHVAPTQRVGGASGRGLVGISLAIATLLGLALVKPWGADHPAVASVAATGQASASPAAPAASATAPVRRPIDPVPPDVWVASPPPSDRATTVLVAVLPPGPSDDHSRIVGLDPEHGFIRWSLSCASGCHPRGSLASSPAGEEIAYVDSVGWIRVVDVLTGESRIVAPCLTCDLDHVTLDWSADGSTIAVDTGGMIWGIPVRSAASEPWAGVSIYRLLVAGADSPSFSPDATQLMYVRGLHIVVAAADGSDPHPLPFDYVLAASWSADGSRVAYVTLPTTRTGGSGIWVSDLSGRHRTKLAELADCCVGGGWPPTPRWSADATNLAWVTAGGRLAVARADRPRPVELGVGASDVTPTWDVLRR